MNITPDAIVLLRIGPVALNATLVWTWFVMAVLTLGAWAVSRKLSAAHSTSRWQMLLEVVLTTIHEQVSEVSRQEPQRFVPFVGTLFLFIAASNLLAILPGYTPPTGSLSTTTALAIAVFIAVPLYGIAQNGFRAYLRHYLRPSWFMLPFNIIGELSRTLALAVRLYGNIMSGTLIVGILLALAPFFFPLVMQLLGLVTGVIQAYIFAVLAVVYIASASAARDESESSEI